MKKGQKKEETTRWSESIHYHRNHHFNWHDDMKYESLNFKTI